MELALRAALLASLVAIASLGPGLPIVARLRLSPVEKLVAVLAVSWNLVYLLAFGLFLFRAPPAAYALGSLLALLACLGSRDTLALFLRNRSSRHVLGLLALLAAWTFLHLGLVRHFGGAWWGGDWLEHAQRAAFFTGRFPGDRPYDAGVVFQGGYGLPARPPLENLLVAFFCKQLDGRFVWPSLTYLLLNVAAFVPCALLLPRLARRGSASVGLLAGLFALNPFFLENATLPWTKLLAAFYVLAGTAFYVRWISKHDGSRLALAAACFAAGVLVHYSAAPFAILAAGHFVVSPLALRRAPARQAVTAAAVAGGLLSTWFGYALAGWGFAGTFLSNTAVADAAGLGVGGNAVKVARNVYFTLVPYFLRGTPLSDVAQARFAGFVRDAAFVAYQTNLLVMPGLIGGPLVLGLLWQGRRHVPWGILAAALLLAIASHGGLELFGVGHVVLQPVVLLAVASLAAGLPGLPRLARALAVAGCGIDYALGGLLHFHLQHLVFRAGHDSLGRLRLLDDGGLLVFSAASWWQKSALGIVFWGDQLAAAGPALEAVAGLGATLILVRMARVLA
jgi:hypothetical protein